MSFDLAILDKNGKPTKYISIAVDDHDQLIRMSKEKGYGLILRMSDYYEDITYQVQEIETLIKEVSQLMTDVNSEQSGLEMFLVKLLELAREAVVEKKALEGIAD